MHFWVSNHIHRCTFGFQSPFIDALLSFIPYSSMHFGFHTHSSMHFWVSHPIHRCTFVFHTSFIDVLWGFKPHSSMHFWSSHRVHQCTLAFWRPETATIDALGLFGGSDWQSSMDSRAPRPLMNGGSQFAFTTFGRPAAAAPIIIPGGSGVHVRDTCGTKSALMKHAPVNFFINVPWGPGCIETACTSTATLMNMFKSNFEINFTSSNHGVSMESGAQSPSMKDMKF